MNTKSIVSIAVSAGIALAVSIGIIMFIMSVQDRFDEAGIKFAHGGTCTFYEDGSNSCNKKINKNQWNCETMGNKQCGKESQNFQDFKEDLKVIEANEPTNHPTQINEDQMIVCNMWKVCQTIDTDDYMSQKSLDKLWNNFDRELDTFNLKDLVN